MAQVALLPYRSAVTGSEQIRALSSFLRAHERPTERHAERDDRPRRARAAVLSVLDTLADAFARHDDRHREHDDLASTIHHAIEAQTFMPRRGHAGVHLVDAVTARFGEFDDVYLVGLVETDWALYQRRSFFYSNTLLKVLGWPQDVDLAAAQRASFTDGLTLARYRTRLSAFQLEGDAVVGLSPLVDAARDLPRTDEPSVPHQDLFPDETWTTGVPPAEIDPEIAAWLALRLIRPALSTPAYGGFVEPRPPDMYRVSRVDRYVTCPFKYFSEYVLRLNEDRDEDTGLTPIERGTLLHLLFERFYKAWQADGRGAITQDLVPEAVSLFRRISDDALSALPGPDRILEELRLHGSMVAPGVAARVFELEAASGAGVRERLLEYELSGPFQFPVLNGLDARVIQIRGKTDRIDVLDDGSLRVVDYKLGRMPDLGSSVQLAVYAHCARLALEARDGRAHPVSAAMYLAFGDDRRFDGRLPGTGQALELEVMTKASDFAGTVERIESGAFPPRPKKTSECQWCGFSGVCRKEYRIEDDEAAEPV
jgi:RecB family exonuclease